MKYNVFGSKSSQDRDVLFFVDSIPSLEDCKKLSIQLNEEIHNDFSDNKIVNSNLGVVKNGVLTEVFKGTVDEVNNSVFLTYRLHSQNFPLEINSLVPRDEEIKALRVARILLSFYSRTIHREDIKKALHADICDKIKVLEKIDFSSVDDFGKKQDVKDIYKNIAFQLGQIIGLWEGKEFYTKESIGQHFPTLQPFLERKHGNLQDLNILKNLYLEILNKKVITFSRLKD